MYYNDSDAYCCAWLRNLIGKGLLPAGDVDERDIEDVRPDDLRGFNQCHFFAGIGGWPYALRLAGWPEGREVWTGSCPCQPFSVAGKRGGTSDPRHLWPEFRRLIGARKPPVVFGEQVAAATQWLAGVRGDLGALGYAVGCLPIQAACAGAPQYRDRFWFVADYSSERGNRGTGVCGKDRGAVAKAGSLPVLGAIPTKDGGDPGLLAGHPGEQVGSAGQPWQRGDVVSPTCDGWGQGWTEDEFRGRGFTAAVASSPDCGVQFIECPDGKWRRLPPPRVRWLGNGIPARVAKLRALGNAIVPQVAKEFIQAFLECQP